MTRTKADMVLQYLQGRSPDEVEKLLGRLEKEAEIQHEIEQKEIQSQQQQLEKLSLDEIGTRLQKTDPVQNKKEFDMLFDIHRKKIDQHYQEQRDARNAAVADERAEIMGNLTQELDKVTHELNYYVSKPTVNFDKIEELHKRQRELMNYKRELEQI
jgi:hypothetical protein